MTISEGFIAAIAEHLYDVPRLIYHAVANLAQGEPAGERGLPNQGYRPGRKTARLQKRKGG